MTTDASRRNSWVRVVLIIVGLLATVLPASAGHSLGARFWYADFDAFYSGAGDTAVDYITYNPAFLYSLQYTCSLPGLPVAVSATCGAGNGWETDEEGYTRTAERSDGVLAVSYRRDVDAGAGLGTIKFAAGAAYHYQQVTEESPSYWTDQRTYHAAELMLGCVLPYGAGFGGAILGSYQPVVIWDIDYEDTRPFAGTDEGRTTGWTVDVAPLRYSSGRFSLKAGLRWQRTDGSKGDMWRIPEDDFFGYYLTLAGRV